MARKEVKGKFKPSAAAEKEFYRQLKKVAIYASHIVERHTEGATIRLPKAMQDELDAYAEKLGPWAARQSAKMLEKVQKSNERAFKEASKKLAREMKSSFVESDVMKTAAGLMFEQVELIKSIPKEAGLRAQRLALEAVANGGRADQIAEELARTTDVTKSRAMLIARTETARANAMIWQSRAQAVGSRQYRWHNSGDAAVRESHRIYRGKRLQGMVFSWDDPPTLDDGMKGHPGSFPNCRCFAEPLFSDD